MINTKLFHFVISVFALFVSDVSAAQPYEYALFKIPGFDGGFSTFTEVWDVNDNAILVGDSFPLGINEFHSFVSNGEQNLDLGTFGGDLSMAWGINSNNTAVGWALTPTARRAFKWTSTEGMTELGDLGGLLSEARSINQTGQICGLSFISSGFPHAFIWDHGIMTDLGVLDSGLESEASGINDLGVVVEQSMNAEGLYRPVMWKDGQIIDLGSLGDGMNRGEAWGINDWNQIVGASWDEKDNRPFIWANDKMFAISHSAGFAWDINNQGQVVGAVFKGNKGFGFIWEQSKGLRHLEDLLPPGAMYSIEMGTGISEGGIISARGLNPSCGPFCRRAFMLVPVKPEMVLSDPVPGVAGVVNSFTVTGARPGAEVKFVYGMKGGGRFVPHCDVLKAVLQIDDAVVMGKGVADGDGVARIEMFVPDRARDEDILMMQCFDEGNCEESQLLVVSFE